MNQHTRIAALCFCVAVVFTPAARAVDVDAPYGVTAFVLSETRWDRVAGAGILWARCEFLWRNVETAQDVFDWSTTDDEVARANARGVKIYAGLGYTPVWASDGGQTYSPPRNSADWRDYVFRCVSRYKDSVKYWEIWNEPNIGGFYGGNRSWQTNQTDWINNILKVAADAAHEADPDCMVVAPELSRCCNCTDWMTKSLQQAGDKIDIISHHQYDANTPAQRLSQIDGMHQTIINLGYGNKPIWITEGGWDSDATGMTETLQGQYLTDMYAGVNARSSWCHNYFWYQIWEGPAGQGQSGLVYQDESPKLSWYMCRDYTTAHPAADKVYVNLSTNDIMDGMNRVNVGDGNTVPDTKASRACRRNDNSAEDFYIYFNVDDTVMYAGNRPVVRVTVDYWDGDSGSITLQYDSTSGGFYKDGGTANRAGKNTWKEAVFDLTDAYFGNRQNSGADFRIAGGGTFYLDVVAVTAAPRPGPGRPTYANPPHATTGVDVNADLSWTTGAGATSHNVYFGSTNPPPLRGTALTAAFDPGRMIGGTKYYWRIDGVSAAGTTNGPLWSFTTIPMPPDKAANPSPADQAVKVSLDADLSWTGGLGVTSHNVYFGTTNPPAARGSQTTTTYDPGTLIRRTTYYWRIDEVNAVGTTTGDLWTFLAAGVRADLDRDGDVDQVDFGQLQACLTDSGVPPATGCADADLDLSNSVEQGDVTVFLRCMSGAEHPANLNCAD